MTGERGQPIPAIVIGLGSVIGLQTARTLTARGVPVIGITGNRRHFAARTRACRQLYEADIHDGGFLDVLHRLKAELPFGAVLVPCTDQSALLVSEHRAALSPTYRLNLAGHDTMTMLADKVQFARFTAAEGLPTPRTVVLNRRDDAERAAATLRFPVVLKPGLKTARWKSGTAEKVRRIGSPFELLGAYDELSPWAELVVQEFVPGGDDLLFTCNAYFDAQHRPLATMMSRKVRQWPPRVGTASLARSVENGQVERLCIELFQRAGFTGLAYVEMKYDQEHDRYVLIEANVGRPTGRSAMAEAVGVELLMTMYADVLGRPLPTRRRQQTTNTHWIDDRRDYLAALQQASKGELSIRDWRRSLHRPMVHAVLSGRDPLPFALDLAQSSLRLLQRATRSRRESPRDTATDRRVAVPAELTPTTVASR